MAVSLDTPTAHTAMTSPQPAYPPALYSEQRFWDKLRRQALRAGRGVVERALCLYYTAQQPGTPAWAKSVIYGALAYFIVPLDAMPDIAPLLGFTDDMSVLAAALVTVALHINDEARAQARSRMARWFGEGR